MSQVDRVALKKRLFLIKNRQKNLSWRVSEEVGISASKEFSALHPQLESVQKCNRSQHH